MAISNEPQEKQVPLVVPISKQVQDILIHNFEAVQRTTAESRKERQRLMAALLVFYRIPDEYAPYTVVDFNADGIFLRVDLPEDYQQPAPENGGGFVPPFVPQESE